MVKDVALAHEVKPAPAHEALQWHVITSEYPPQPGGVSDYTYRVAAAVAGAGDEVHVWCPPHCGAQPQAQGVTVHRELDKMTGTDLRKVGEQLDSFPAPRRILVQWVPHGYGRRSMNVDFCIWLWRRAVFHHDNVQMMVHEPCLSFSAGWRQTAAALVHRLMTVILLRAASRVWVSIPGWIPYWRPYAFGRKVPFHWLPVPSNIPVAADSSGVDLLRRRWTPRGEFLIGHFGTYGSPVTDLLEPILVDLAQEDSGQVVLLMGRGSEEFRAQLVRKLPHMSRIILATGELRLDELSRHIAACDLLIQPYPDGISTRRTSFMTALCHGKPVVATTGHLTEPMWRDSAAVALAPVGDTAAFMSLVEQLRADSPRRGRMGVAARDLYRQRFDIAQLVSVLRGQELASGAPECES
jgi:glycosyltransferase involved in cell wall biosynthesis